MSPNFAEVTQWNAEVCIQPPSSITGKVLALVMPLCVWHTPYVVLWRWAGSYNGSDHFSAAFNRISHQGILFKLCSVGLDVQCRLF